MRIDTTGNADLEADPALHWQSTESHTIGWKGNLFLPGQTAGAATVGHLLDRLGKGDDLATACVDLRGIFGLFVLDRTTQRWTAMGDHGGLYRIFYTPEEVGTSFLELARRNAAGKLDPKAVVEFIAIGGNFGNHTPLNGIKKLRRDEFLTLDPSAPVKVSVGKKPLPALTDHDDSFVDTYFDDLAHAIRSRRVSADVTGGFDTRLIACLLSRRDLPFECGLSGVRGSTEFATASRVAEQLGRAFHFTVHDISSLEDDLQATFLAGDGLTEIPRLHRNRQLCLDRLARGVEIMLHGGGGGFFQDHYVVHDFPRYGSSRIDVERYFRLRIKPISIPAGQLTAMAAALEHQAAAEVIQKFRDCQGATNNESYEQAAYRYRTPEFYGATFSNYINMGMDVEAPFLDWRMIDVAMHLSPWQRMFMGWHRKLISCNCPALAELPTVDGYTASNQKLKMLREFGTYVAVQLSRVARKLGERYVGKSLFHRVGELDAEPPTYRAALRRSPQFGAALDRLKACSIFAGDLDPEQVRNVHVGRILTMGMLLAYLDGADFGD